MRCLLSSSQALCDQVFLGMGGESAMKNLECNVDVEHK